MEDTTIEIRFNGYDLTFDIDLPIGSNRHFLLEAQEIMGNLQPRAIYRGKTISDVTPEGTVINIPLEPVIPLVRLSPVVKNIQSGDIFTLDLEVFNLENLCDVGVRFENIFDYIYPVSAERGRSLKESHTFTAQYGGDNMYYQINISASNDPTTPLVDAEGYAHLATITFSSEYLAGTDIVNENIEITPIYFVSCDSGEFLLDEIYFQRSFVNLSPFEDRIITFPDANLDLEVHYHLDMGIEETLMLSDVLKITYFYANDDAVQIEDLTGIGQLANLEELTLNYHRFTDLTPLTELTRLSYLNLNAQVFPFESLEPLSNMTSLRWLYLEYNEITDITSLAELTDLYTLSLNNNDITEITPLSGLTNINTFYLAYNNISDISPLIDNPGLGNNDYVDLSGNPLSEESINTYIPILENRGVYVLR